MLQQIRAVTNGRASSGHRRVWAMASRTFRVRYNRKRIHIVVASGPGKHSAFVPTFGTSKSVSRKIGIRA